MNVCVHVKRFDMPWWCWNVLYKCILLTNNYLRGSNAWKLKNKQTTKHNKTTDCSCNIICDDMKGYMTTYQNKHGGGKRKECFALNSLKNKHYVEYMLSKCRNKVSLFMLFTGNKTLWTSKLSEEILINWQRPCFPERQQYSAQYKLQCFLISWPM